MAKEAESYSTHFAGAMRELTAEGKLLEAADIFAAGNKVPKAVRAKFFAREFGTGPEHVPALCRDIAALNAKAWITTNFDSNLRYALSNRTVDPYTNTMGDLQAALSFLDERLVLINLHGVATSYDTLAYSTETYRVHTRLGAYHQLLRRIFSQEAVLTIGFSFTDPPFQEALHFIKDELGSHTSRLHVAILPQSASVNTALLSHAGFELVLYDASNGHDYAHACIKSLSKCGTVSTALPEVSTPRAPNMMTSL